VSENSVLRGMFRSKRKEGAGDWRRLRNEELYNLYTSPNIIREINWRRLIWAGHVARMGDMRNIYNISVAKPKGKRPHGKPRRRGKDNMRMDITEIWWQGVNWMSLA
jgi:hypothetical protein